MEKKNGSICRAAVYSGKCLHSPWCPWGRALDPFCGAGSTLAAEALRIDSVGVEVNPEYYEMALRAVPELAKLKVDPWFLEREVKKKGKIMALTSFLLNEV